MHETTEAGLEPRTNGDAPSDNKYRDLSDFRRDILHALRHVEPAVGVTILRHISRYREEEIRGGRFYPNLNALAEMGLIEKAVLDGRSNEYGLTDAGKNALAARRRWENNGEVVEGSA